MNLDLFSGVTRSITLALTSLGLVAATVYQFVTHGTADSALLGATTGIVGAFTGYHIALGASTAGAGTPPSDPTGGPTS